ncbi:MAG TPA: aromatic ring-hydroxylating dioxygenase subunit alpha [Myxococcales bacterium]|nr:aromatic ring-hydroxylating dioxygenase subunit alpha [Myxococcales bacterium]
MAVSEGLDKKIHRLKGVRNSRVIDASRYNDPEFQEREIEGIFQRSWLVAGPARWLQKAGDYFCLNEMGESIVLLCDQDGVLRAFHNICRHRGTRLLDGRGNIGAIRCPYHDWKYSLDGRLRHIPGAKGFAEPIDKPQMGLLPVNVDTALGFVWINLSENPPALRSTLAGLDQELAHYNLEEMVPIQEKVWELPHNWKAVLDNATESYHLLPVHGSSVNPFIGDVPEFTTYEDHYRLTLGIATYGWRKKVDEWTSRGGPYTDLEKSALHKYVLFPNFLINVLPYHLTVFQVWPIAPNRSRFFYGFYMRKGAGLLERARAYATWMASRYILVEDFDILDRFQDGANTTRVSKHRFHDGEIAMDHFHKVLDRRLKR